MKTRSAEVKLSRKVQLPRTCSACRHEWQGIITITASSSTESTMSGPSDAEKFKAQEEAERKLNGEERRLKREGDPHREVLCPRCGHFDEGAMKEHFPNGFATSIVEKFKAARKGALAQAVISGPLLILPTRGLYLFYFAPPERQTILRGVREAFDANDIEMVANVFIPFFSTALAFALAYLFLTGLITFGRALINGRSIMKFIRGSSEDELRQLAVNAYKNGRENDLRDPDGWVLVLSQASAGGPGAD